MVAEYFEHKKFPPEGECVIPAVPLRTLKRPGNKQD
jgi:hypothetical protein